MQKRQAHSDEADDHSRYCGENGPPGIVVGLLLPEALCFSFITQPTKRRLSLGIIGAVTAAIERAGFRRATVT